ncbi:MAG TPA: hypothetical protein VJ746_11810 [Nitrospira sp.]|nr:hypothetical protein [Nitrospira sp.]
MPIALVPCLWFSVTFPQSAQGSGELIGVQASACYGNGPQSATFTPTRYTYASTGDCDLAQTRLNLPVTVHWTGSGTYDPPTGRASENIIVPPPRIDQPSRPYGQFQAVMHCAKDPWLNVDVTCDHIAPTVDAPLDNTAPNAMGYKQPFPLGPIITGSIQQSGRPYTSAMNPDARARLNQQYGAFEAQQRAQAFQHELQMKRGGMVRPRGIEGEQPAEPAPSAPDAPQPESGTQP